MIVDTDNLTEFQREQRERRKELDSRARKFRMVEAVRTVLQRTDRIVTGKANLRVTMSRGVQAPSWTDGESVYLNEQYVERDLADPNVDMPKFVIRWKGANYHEVAHILLTPRMDDPLTEWLRRKVKEDNDKRWWYSYNALEDQRIETQYTKLYTPTVPYFTQTVLHFLLKDTSAVGRMFPLIYGRKYLAPKLRRAVREPFVKLYGQQLADDFAAVIDEYLTLVLPRDDTRARKLIGLYYNLLVSSDVGGPGLPDLSCGDNGGGKEIPQPNAQNNPTKGKPRIGEQKRAARRILDDMESDDIDNDDLDDMDGDGNGEGDGDGEGEGDSDDGYSNGKGGKDGKTDASSPGKPNPVRDHQKKEEELPAGEAAEEFGTAAPVDSDDVLDAIRKATEQAKAEIAKAEADPNMAVDVQDTCRSITSASQAKGDVATDHYGHHRLEMPEQQTMKLARDVESIIRQIQLDLEPQWNRGEPVGRINIDRFYMRKADPGMIDIFDQWDEGGEDEAGVEVVILIDLSGSMSGQIVGASRGLWAIKRAFDNVGIRTTVIGFSDSHVVLYKPSDKAPKGMTPLFSTIGGTNPDGAIREAYNILSRSQEPNKLLFAITDGAWSGNADEQDTIIAALRKAGVVTTLMAIGHNVLTWGGGHGMDVAMTVETINDLPKVILTTVRMMMKKVVMH